MDLLGSKRLQGGFMGGNRFPVDIPRLVDFYLRGLLDLDRIANGSANRRQRCVGGIREVEFVVAGLPMRVK